MNLDWLAEGLLPLVAVKSLVLLSIAWVVALLLRRPSAAAAHRACTLGFVGCALLPLVTLVHGWTLPGGVVPAEITAAQPLVPELPGEGLTYDDRAEASLPPQV